MKATKSLALFISICTMTFISAITFGMLSTVIDPCAALFIVITIGAFILMFLGKKIIDS